METSIKVKSRVWAGLFLVVGLLVTAAIPVYATKKEVEDARKKANSLEAEKKKVEATLRNLEGLKQDAVAYVRELDGSLSDLNQELEQLEEQIVRKEADIEETKKELNLAKEVEAKQYESMKLRIKYMYERGETSYLDLLLQSKNMVQLMNRAEYIHKIAEYDRRKLDEYAAAKEAVTMREIQLEEEHEELLLFQEQTEAKQQSVEILLAQKNQELKNFESQIDTAQGQISEYEKDIQDQENKDA